MSAFTRKCFLDKAASAAIGASAAGATMRALQGAASAATGKAIPVRMGWQPTLNGARYFVAQDAGIFAKNGLQIQPVKFLAGPPFFSAFESKSIDVGFMGTPPASVGIAQGVPMKIFAIENYAPGSEALVVRPGSGINSLRDLKGKKIAAQRGTSGEYALIQGLKSVGMTLNDVHFVNLDVTALLPAFQRGDIDGGWYWEPWQGELRLAGGKQLTTDGDVHAAGGIVWVARPEWLEQNGEAVQRVLRSLDDALPILQHHHEQVISYLHHDIGVADSITKREITVEASWPTMKQSWSLDYALSINPRAVARGKGLIEVLNKLARYQQEVRAIDAAPNFSAAIETKYVKEYVASNGAAAHA
ncbi:MAG: NrtA/SsuA/CpmA family ABC transporter substrate-binding protein [bacterium]|nr:NrtA/SsuA/CpmA family ABC transporter substrate-binding protein [bacterium]